MLRGQDQKSDAEDSVDSGSKGANLLRFNVAVGNVETDLHSFAAAHPVALHGQDLFRPVQQTAKVQQFLSVVGNLQEPLFQVPSGNGSPAAVAASVHHLLVGQYRLAGRTPNHRGFSSVGQSLFIKLQEQPLVPAIVFRQTANYFPVPIINCANRAKLAPHGLDVFHCPVVGMDTPADSGILRRQAKGVETDGMQYVVSLHPAEASVAIGGSHCVPVADMQVSGGIGVHRQVVPLGPRVVVYDSVKVIFGPAFLPFTVNFHRIEAQFNRSGRGSHLRSPQTKRTFTIY